MLLDPRGLLLGGLRALLAPVAAAQVPPAQLRVGFFDPQTAAALGAGLPLVVLSLGKARLLNTKLAGFGASTYGARDANGNVTVLTAKQFIETPVTISCVAAGLVADGIVGALAQAVTLALLNTPSVPLPDSVDTFAATDPLLTSFGLTAQLFYAGELDVSALEMRQVARRDLLFTARHYRYDAGPTGAGGLVPLVATVTTTTHIGVAIVPPAHGTAANVSVIGTAGASSVRL